MRVFEKRLRDLYAQQINFSGGYTAEQIDEKFLQKTGGSMSGDLIFERGNTPIIKSSDNTSWRVEVKDSGAIETKN